MKKNFKWRIITVTVLAVVCLYLIYPTVRWAMLSDEQKDARLQQWSQEDSSALNTDSIFKRIGRSVARWAQGDRSRTINLGLDLQGGIELRYKVDTSVAQKAIDEAEKQAEKGISSDQKAHAVQVKQEYIVRRALSIIRDRVDMLGTTEPVIQQSGNDRIYVQLPGEKDPARVKKLIGRTAQLKFQLAAGSDLLDKTLRDIDAKLGGRLMQHFTVSRGDVVFPEADKPIVDSLLAEADKRGLIPEKYQFLYGNAPKPTSKQQMRKLYLINKNVLMTGETLVSATGTPERNSRVGAWQVDFVLSTAGGRQFRRITTDHVKERLAIVLDQTVQTAPTINEPIGSRGQITGGFTPTEARDLAIVLEAGALPAPLELIYEGTVGPTLGRESIRAGVMAALLGFVLVIVFMLFYYRLPGIIAVMALLFNVPLILGALAYFHATLTLPGIAGLVLTTGMAVDANVLIFERIREEFKKGKTIRAAIDTGFSKAFLTIIDSNLTTLIAALVLFQFGTGPIKGFAVTLSIGILSSMFTALFFSRLLFDLLTKYTSISKLPMRSVVGDTHIPFVYWRHVAITLSSIAILVGMTAFTIRGKDNLGVDFTQGTVMRLRFEQPTTTAALQSTLAQNGFRDVIVQESGSGGKQFEGRTFVLRAANSATADVGNKNEDTAVAVSDQIQEVLRGSEGIPKYEILSVESIGAAVSGELTRQAFLAVLNATIAMIIYISIRFHFKFALGGVIALFHDILITLGIFALCGREITLPVVAALLTIMGYSINDTIVIFDRIREDMKLMRGRDLAEVMNISINETLRRTALTSFTTLLAVGSILILGGAVIRDFAFALTIGVIVGTYSSIFVASPVVLMMTKVRGVASARSSLSRGSALLHLFEKLGGSSTRTVTTSTERGRKK
ncbi:MAG: protein translocase subunit SecD [Candidatus Hydrogenedentes bacterium]|nr:protein translocase subunit SecD [Candidatus Hydrogenedentota bacterium]